MNKIPNIKITVACHKPSELPQSEVFMPVQVGAAISKLDLPIAHDDTGENISAKNPEYCELTAQYWSWKNVEADYYGLCHYRRFLCLKPINKVHNSKKSRNLRGHIEASILNKYNMERFGLEDTEEMQEIISKHDLIIGEEQNVKLLYTPNGNQNTAYKHWAAHDRALVMKADLDRMLEILNEVSPKIGKAAHEYLNGGTFLGFNCFVMKKELFNELCEIEFEVLSRLEKEVDLSNYCQQLSRIYGFMAEIISSSYFYYIEKTGKYKVKRVPIVYFNYTDPINHYAPLEDKKSIPIIFNHADSDLINFGTVWQSFLDHTVEKTNYDVIVVSPKNQLLEEQFIKMAKDYKNVSLRFYDADSYRGLLFDKYEITDDKPETKQIEDDSNHLSLLPFLPFIFTKHEKTLVFDENIIFMDTVDKLWEEYNGTNAIIAAPHDAYIQARVNDIYYNTLERYLDQQMKSPLNYFSTSTFICDFAKYRDYTSVEQIVDTYRRAGENQLRNKEELVNVIFEDQVEYISQKWNVWYESNDHLKYQLPYAPLNIYKDLQAARREPGIITYMPNDSFDANLSELHFAYWKVARRTVFYEYYVKKMIDLVNLRAKTKNRDLLVKLFPVDGKMRGRLTKIFPYDAKRTKAVKKVLSKARIR